MTKKNNRPIKIFPKSEFDRLFKKRGVTFSYNYTYDQDKLLGGWSTSGPDPMALLTKFKHLKIKEGFILRSLQYYNGMGGNAIIYAMTIEDSDKFPMGQKFLTNEDIFEPPFKPPNAITNFMEKIEGDGTPESYLSASIFARDVKEYGAFWHGCSWCENFILFKGSLSTESNEDSWGTAEAKWKWKKPKPKILDPHFDVIDDKPTITFHTIDRVGREILYRFTDTFIDGTLNFESHRETLAEGVGGIIF